MDRARRAPSADQAVAFEPWPPAAAGLGFPGRQQRAALLRYGIAWLGCEVLGDAEVAELDKAFGARTGRRGCARLEGDDEVLGDTYSPADGHKSFGAPVVTAGRAGGRILGGGEILGHTEPSAGGTLESLGALITATPS